MFEMIVGALSLACEGVGKNVVAVGNERGSDVVKGRVFFLAATPERNGYLYFSEMQTNGLLITKIEAASRVGGNKK